MEKVALEKAKTAAETRAPKKATSESTARKTDDSGRYQCLPIEYWQNDRNGVL